jgi:transcriptional regulator GlxA family with amidase domain
MTIATAGSARITQPVRVPLMAMSDDLARPWTVEELARIAAVSPSRPHRLFRAEVGSTPLGWLTRSRAEASTILANAKLRQLSRRARARPPPASSDSPAGR